MIPAIRIGVPAPAVAKVMIPPEINTIMTIIIIVIIIGLNITVQLYRTGYSPVLKVDAHDAHVRGTKESWGDQKAG